MRRPTCWMARWIGASLAFTFLKASQTSRFEMSNGFALVMRLLPSLVGRLPKAGYRCPFGPAPLQDLPPYCGQLRPCVLHRSIDPHRVHRFGRFPSHQDDRFPRSVQKPVSESRRLRAGCRLGRASGLRPSLSRDDHMTSVSTSTMPFRPFIDGLLSLVSPRRTSLSFSGRAHGR